MKKGYFTLLLQFNKTILYVDIILFLNLKISSKTLKNYQFIENNNLLEIWNFKIFKKFILKQINKIIYFKRYKKFTKLIF
jgi:hypothetical protein